MSKFKYGAPCDSDSHQSFSCPKASQEIALPSTSGTGQICISQEGFHYSQVGFSNKNIQKGPQFGSKLSRSQNKDTDLFILCDLRCPSDSNNSVVQGDDVACCPRNDSRTVASGLHSVSGWDRTVAASLRFPRVLKGTWMLDACTMLPPPLHPFLYLFLSTCLEYFETVKTSISCLYLFKHL